VEICLVDQLAGFGNGRRLPAGPLREPITRLETIDFLIEQLPAGNRKLIAEGYGMRLSPGDLTGLHDGNTISIADAIAREIDIHAVAGIARPERFFEMLQSLGINTQNHAFADHHRFRKSDFEHIPVGDMIVMTEKDAVKCRNLALFDAWYIPVEAVFSETLEKELMRKLNVLKRARRPRPGRGKRS
jgi:tetraacyldisaccharide 4'-kinase